MARSQGGNHAEHNPSIKRRKFPVRIRYVVVAAVVVWAGIHLGHQREELQALNAKQASLNHQLAGLQAEQTKLTTESKQLQDKNYILALAEKEFNLVLPGQVAFDIHH